MSNKEFHNLAEAQLNLNSTETSYWGNLGLWRADVPPAQQDYAEACTAMAQLLAEYAQLNSNDVVLDIGFGCGDQLLLWLQRYGVEQLYGLNISTSQTQLSQQRLISAGYTQQAQQLFTASCADMAAMDGGYAGNAGAVTSALKWASSRLSASPTKILALDCAYHFADRQQFLADSYSLLAPQGQLVLCDLLLDESAISLRQNLALKALCRLCKIPYANLLKQAEYLDRCKTLGFEVQNFDDRSEQVFLPFGQWLQAYQQQHRDKKLSWGKYSGTAWFLRWAKRQEVLRYVVINLSKPKPQGDT